MSRKNEQKLRRQLEVLKAQLKSEAAPMRRQVQTAPPTLSPVETPTLKPQLKQTSYTLDFAKIKSDMKKTLIFSIFTISLLLSLYFTQGRWVHLIKFI